MEKRLILAITLSFLFLAVYSSASKKLHPVENKIVAAQNNATVQTSVQAPKTPPALLSEDSLKKSIPEDVKQCIVFEDKDLYKIDDDGLLLKFSKRGGYLVEAYDKERKTPLVFKNIGFTQELSDVVFKIVELPKGISFEYTFDDGSIIKKVFRIKSDNSLELTVCFYHVNDSKIKSYDISAGSFNPLEHKDPVDQRYCEIASLVKDVVVRKPGLGQKSDSSLDGRIQWIGLRDRYFCSIVVPQLLVNKADIKILDKNVSLVLTVPERVNPKDGSGIEDVYKIYLGPQEESRIKAFSPGAEQIVNYGFFDAISKVLLLLLRICHKLTHSWGLAIIFVTILVYIILFPLSLKSMMSMKKMQALAPKMEELKSKFKDNPQKLNMEIMELYKREKANPFAGCLPMILQIPVFFALYQLLMRFISLKGASFLWIKDLSEPDRLIIFNQNIPFFGNEFNILPIAMAIIMFFQQKFSVKPAGASPEIEQQQKIMSIMMPLIFGALFYKMSSGLVLYWSINSLLMVLFQWKISKKAN